MKRMYFEFETICKIHIFPEADRERGLHPPHASESGQIEQLQRGFLEGQVVECDAGAESASWTTCWEDGSPCHYIL